MKINVQKITDEVLAQRACQFTLHSHSETSIPLERLYHCGHSPIRTQLFWIELLGIPSFVSVHLVRHNVGITHFVQTQRSDRGADGIADRHTPVNHAFLANAESLINMGRKRLCTQASGETRYVMKQIKNAVQNVDPDLAKYIVADCVYRGKCVELKPCGVIGGEDAKL